MNQLNAGYRTFLIIWTGQFLSRLGTAMTLSLIHI